MKSTAFAFLAAKMAIRYARIGTFTKLIENL
jgi:hypothetical protein